MCIFGVHRQSTSVQSDASVNQHRLRKSKITRLIHMGQTDFGKQIRITEINNSQLTESSNYPDY